MTLQDRASSTRNASGTYEKIDTPLTHGSSRDVLRRDLIALRVRHGASTPIGYRCSNLIELLQVPELPSYLIARQAQELKWLLANPQ